MFISRIYVKNKVRFVSLFVKNRLQKLFLQNSFSTFYQSLTFSVYHGSTRLLSVTQTSANFPPGWRKNLKFLKTLVTYVRQSKVDALQLEN